MVSAIGSSSFSIPTGVSTSAAGASTAGLDAQLARYQKALSECVSCDSAKTREGKEAIQDISGKISDVKARIAEIAAAKSNTRPATPNARTSSDLTAHAEALAGNAAVATASASDSATATVGNRLDVFA